MPKLCHAGANLRVNGGEFTLGQRIARLCLAPVQHLVAGRQQLGYGALGIQNAFALHLGGVGGEHRRDKAVRQRLRNRVRGNTGPAQARDGHVNAALLRFARALMHGAPTDVVAVFSQIGQVAEIGKCADDADRLVGA